MIETKRRTGRTSRMLDAARLVAQKGREVYVIAASLSHADALRRMLGSDAKGIKVECADGIGAKLDWATMKLRGHLVHHVVFVDHYTIESRFAPILGEWMRFDQESIDTKERNP
jgi:hypothetical protein